VSKNIEAIRTPVIDWTAAQLPTRVQRLANGLTVIAHPDRKSPVVAVYVGYRAGSRDEPRTKAGVAHLCEHLMFSGTKAFPGSYFAPFEQAGAAWMNAFVKEDYSAYFATLPAGALDFALRMEADRLAHLAEALDAEKVDRQREVVRNELRQRESEPYGGAIRILAELAHPPDHPYSHPPDGLVEELDNISIDDVREWIETRHVAANVEVIIAGDVEPGDAIEKACHHFAAIAARPAIARPAHPVVTVAGASRKVHVSPKVKEQAIKHARLYIAWNGPAFASPDYPALEAACALLAGGKSSRLWYRIVEAERLATELAVEFRPRALGSLVVLHVTARDGAPLGALETAVRHELERLSRDGPSADELDIARLRLFGGLVRGIERVGGPQSKSDMLGLAALVGGSPDIHEQRIAHIATMAPDAVAAVVRRWLAAEGAVLEMRAAP
jgi:zinc protease